jgi:hypothetical protein
MISITDIGTAAWVESGRLLRQLQNSKKGVTPAKAVVQKFLKRLDSRFHGNDNLGLMQLALLSKIPAVPSGVFTGTATFAFPHIMYRGDTH